MSIVFTVLLPAALITIMFSLGLGLVPEDFRRIVARPKAFAIGAVSQLIFMPVLGLAIALAFQLPPELAMGVMILAFSPGGVTSNLMSKLAYGDVALSVSLTAAFSIIAVFTVPPAVKLASLYFLGSDSGAVSVASLGVQLFFMTTLPVAVGMFIRYRFREFALRAEPVVGRLSLALFVVIVVGALLANWRLFLENLPILGPCMILYNVLLLFGGMALAKLFSLSESETTAIAIETGIQNATAGIAIGSLIMDQIVEVPVFSLPSGVYGITMYLVSMPFVMWRRRVALARRKAAATASS